VHNTGHMRPMSLRKTYVAKRKDSSNFQFMMRVPKTVLEQVQGRQIIIPFPVPDTDPEVVETTIGKFVQFLVAHCGPEDS
jgi:hypothetical protein